MAAEIKVDVIPNEYLDTRISWITPRVGISGIEVTYDEEDIVSQKVTHVASILDWDLSPSVLIRAGVKHKTFYLKDSDKGSISEVYPILCEAVDWILLALLSNPDAKILVHCVAGVSRSPTVVAAYLMSDTPRLYRPYSMEGALAEIRRIRPEIDPNPLFRECLEIFEREEADRIKVVAAAIYSVIEPDTPTSFRSR